MLSLEEFLFYPTIRCLLMKLYKYQKICRICNKRPPPFSSNEQGMKEKDGGSLSSSVEPGEWRWFESLYRFYTKENFTFRY